MLKDKNNYTLVSIVTVAYKDDKYLPGLLESIERLECPNFGLEVIIVEILSAKKKKSIKKIFVKQILIQRKMGYAEAVNIGIANARGEYVFLPNPDTIVEKTALTRMLNYLMSHNDVGITVPKVFLMDDPAKISYSDLPCKYFNAITGELTSVTANELADVNSAQEFYWVCGNGIMLKKILWEQAGKYDESFFLYWEDADFSMKVRRLGYKSVLIHQAKLLHKGSGSIGATTDQAYYVVRNGRYFINKYSSFSGRCILHVTSFLLIISKSLQVFFGTGDKMNTKAFIEGIVDFYRGKRGAR